MPVYKTYQCPDCEGYFRFLHHPTDEPPPNFCPLCGADVSGKPKKKGRKRKMREAYPLEDPNYKPVIFKTNGIGKTADSVYRGMEAAADERIRQAAALLGEDPRSLASMKMTNMKDNLREGDFSMAQSHTPSSATEITGPVSGPLQPGQVAFQDKAAAVEFAKTVGQGAHPFAGNRAREMVVSSHQARVNSVVSAGRVNKK